MRSIEASLIVSAVLLAGLVLFFSALKLAQRVKKRQVSIRVIFKGFGQKMWMTAGIGLAFLGLYLAIAILISYFNDPQSRLNVFMLVYEHPVLFIYLGLLVFALLSISIYLVRLVIKYLYNSCNKH